MCQIQKSFIWFENIFDVRPSDVSSPDSVVFSPLTVEAYPEQILFRTHLLHGKYAGADRCKKSARRGSQLFVI
jgi:hypothetical protein